MIASEKTLLLIRAIEQARNFVQELDVEIDVIYAPMIAIEPLPIDVESVGSEILIFTSANAVRLWISKTGSGKNACYCVGSQTQTLAAENGFQILGNFETAQDLLEHVISNHAKPAPLLYPRGLQISVDLTEHLSRRDFKIEDVILYRQKPLPLSPDVVARIKTDSLILPIFSQHIAQRLGVELENITPADLTLVAISAPVANHLSHVNNAKTIIAPSPSRASMCDTIGNMFR